jgi:hypothetical protein
LPYILTSEHEVHDAYCSSSPNSVVARSLCLSVFILNPLYLGDRERPKWFILWCLTMYHHHHICFKIPTQNFNSYHWVFQILCCAIVCKFGKVCDRTNSSTRNDPFYISMTCCFAQLQTHDSVPSKIYCIYVHSILPTKYEGNFSVFLKQSLQNKIMLIWSSSRLLHSLHKLNSVLKAFRSCTQYLDIEKIKNVKCKCIVNLSIQKLLIELMKEINYDAVILT